MLKAAFLGLVLLAAGSTVYAQDTPKTEDKPAQSSLDPKDRIAPDIKPEALWDGRKMVPFRALDFPKMVKAADADFVDDTEYILGVTLNGESRAYPTRYVWWHHVVNDKMGEGDKTVPFVVTYCSVCNTGIGFDTRLNGTPLMFDFYGLYNGVAIMADRDTGSVWLPVSAKAVKGERTGEKLTTIPVLDTTWGEWKKLHPDTLVMSPDNEFRRAYRDKTKQEPRGYDSFPAPFFKPTLTREDARLPQFDKVLGVAVETKKDIVRRAYPVSALNEANGIIHDEIEKTPVVVFLEQKTTTANAFDARLDRKKLTFETRKSADGVTEFVDTKTQSVWNVEGIGIDGKLKGKSLKRLENHLSQWYGWAAYFPETTIYSKEGAAK
jgi:hypothetical protein